MGQATKRRNLSCGAAVLFRFLGCLSLSLPLAILTPAFSNDGENSRDEPTEDGSQPYISSDQFRDADAPLVDSAKLTIEGLLLRRKDLTNVPFTKQGDAPAAGTMFVPFNSSELNTDDVAAGVRGSLEAEVFNQPIEFSGFYMDPMVQNIKKFGFNQSLAAFNTDAIYEGLPGNDIPVQTASDDIDGLAVTHQTHLFGAEVNVLRPFGIPGLLVGARGLNFGEDFSATTTDPGSIPPAGSTRDHVTIRADNRLLGVQAGLQHMFRVNENLNVGGSIKAGVFDNFVDLRRTFVSELRPDLRSFDRSYGGDVFAQAVEFNPRLEWQLADGVMLSASGQFLWINNVSEAVTHYASSADLDDRNLRANGSTYFYGGSLGLTFQLENAFAPEQGLTPIMSGAVPATEADLDERIAALEESTARKGNQRLSLDVSGSINRMLLGWNDGLEKDVYVVENNSSRSRIEFNGAAKIARGWSAGYYLSLGLDDASANDVSQLSDNGDEAINIRHSTWWLRNNALGAINLGFTSTATDNIILKDVGGIMPGAANISLIGGGLFVRRSDLPEQPDDESLLIQGAFTTSLDDFAAGGSVDTLRRNVFRYDAPRFSGQWGNLDFAAAVGEDNFYDVAIEHSLNYNDWKWRFGVGWLNDKDAAGQLFDDGTPEQRDRTEWKGSASLLHVPSGLFGTAAYVHRTFNGASDSQQTVFGENTTGYAGPIENRPATDYFYAASGIRRAFSSLGETSVYGEFAQVDDAVTGLREGRLLEVTDSRLQMVGAAISQNIDAAAMDVYMGVRHFRFDTEGVICRGSSDPAVCNPATSFASPVPLNDLTIGYAGARIKF